VAALSQNASRTSSLKLQVQNEQKKFDDEDQRRKLETVLPREKTLYDTEAGDQFQNALQTDHFREC
jgi:hypothetical protein